METVEMLWKCNGHINEKPGWEFFGSYKFFVVFFIIGCIILYISTKKDLEKRKHKKKQRKLFPQI
jgi:hypothetical protein